MAKLLLGKEVTDALNADLQMRTAALREKGVVPTLGITLLAVGEIHPEGRTSTRRPNEA